MLRWLAFLSILILTILIDAEPSSAEIKTITATGEYRMGDNDTRTDAKRLALLDAKRLALEQAGTYLESVTEVKNLGVTRDELNAYTAGIVEVIELDTKDVLEAATHIIRVQVTAKIDTDVIARQIDALRKNETAKAELMRLRAERSQLRQEVEAKTRELRVVQSKAEAEAIARQRQQVIAKAVANDLLDEAVGSWVWSGAAFLAPMRGCSESALAALNHAENLTVQALLLDPSSPFAKQLMIMVLLDEGSCLDRQGKRDKAVLVLREAIRLWPNDDSVHYRVAQLLLLMGDFDGAVDESRSAISLEPQNANYHVTLGQALSRKGDDEGAVNAYHAAIRLDPNNGFAHIGLGMILKARGLKDEGERYIQKGMGLQFKKNERLRKEAEDAVKQIGTAPSQ